MSRKELAKNSGLLVEISRKIIFAAAIAVIASLSNPPTVRAQQAKVEETTDPVVAPQVSKEENKTKKSESETSEPKEPDQIEPLSNSSDPEPGGNNIYAIVGGLAALAAAGGGGGSGGGGAGSGGGSAGSGGGPSDGQYRNTADGIYSTEFNNQSMLRSINALSLNDYGYTGAGIKVGVVDSGIDSTHSEFDGKTIYGHDFANSSSGYGADELGHGSHVASIIAGERDGLGMRGVAYDATLYDYKLDNDGVDGLEGLTTDSQLAAVFNRHVTDDIHVSNNSWGSGTSVTLDTEAVIRALYPNTIAAIRAAQSNGTLIVFSAGNDEDLQPDSSGALPYHINELANEWLVVVAVDSSLSETIYTNRCGVAADFCVTAPGGGDSPGTEGILAAEANGSYVRFSGTSMAAPHVSGLAAALMEKFPSLTPAQIATRIKSTASYSGLTGSGGETSANSSTAVMQAIFGHGLVNATAASSRIGNYIYANGGDLDDGIDLSATRIAIPAGLPTSVQDQILENKFIVFDSFDNARFSVEGSQVFSKFSVTSPPSLSTTNVIDTHNDPSFSFASSAGNLKILDWMPRFIAFSSSGRETASKAFWGELSSLFPAPKMMQIEPSASYIWNQTYKGLSFQPFVQFRSENYGVTPTFGYGASFNLRSNGGLNLQPGQKSGSHSKTHNCKQRTSQACHHLEL